MMLVKKSNGRNHLQPTFTSLLDDFFNAEAPSLFNRDHASARVPSVNVIESEDSFRIEVAAPGFNKDDFTIDVDDNLLTISGEWQTSDEKKEEKYTKREFSYSSFKRSFNLPETIDVEKIAAGYEGGILKVELPKLAEVRKPSKTIKIS